MKTIIPRPSCTLSRGRSALHCASALALACTVGGAAANTPQGMLSAMPPAPFADRSLEDWQERSFVGHSDYTLTDYNGVRVLRADTDGEASILYREQKINLSETPILSWSWKINNTYGDIDERSRDGDDFPARLYVVAKTGFLPWETLALNYVWSSSSPRGTTWRNPFTDKAGMIAVRSGDDAVGRWTLETRDVMADFEAVFGRKVDEIDGFALMIDGDNAGKSGTAWFGNIAFEAADQ